MIKENAEEVFKVYCIVVLVRHWCALAAITRCHSLGDLNSRSIFSHFWKLDVQEKSASGNGFS